MSGGTMNYTTKQKQQKKWKGLKEQKPVPKGFIPYHVKILDKYSKVLGKMSSANVNNRGRAKELVGYSDTTKLPR